MDKLSRSKEYDRTNRILIMENMGVMMRMFKRTGGKIWLDRAAEFGAVAKKLSQRIKNHDYKKEDEEYKLADEMDRAAQNLSKKLQRI